MTATYDLAFCGDLLIACVPHGSDINTAIREESEKAGVEFDEINIIEDVILTDETEDDDEVVYSGHAFGWLGDINGRTYDYAVRRGLA